MSEKDLKLEGNEEKATDVSSEEVNVEENVNVENETSTEETVTNVEEEITEEKTEKVEDEVKEQQNEENKTAEKTATSENEKVNEALEKGKKLLANKKLVGIIAAVFVAIIALFIWNSGPKSIAGDVKVTFSGYDTKGRAEYNSAEIRNKISEIVAEEVGLSKETNLDLAKFGENAAKYQQYITHMSSINIRLDKTTNLSNGDTVTLTITTGKESPIKSETKTFKVSGLKEVEKVSTKDLISDKSITFLGYNGYGRVEFSNNNFIVESEKANGRFSNGDKVKIKPTNSYISELESQGKVFKDNDTYEVEVKGLLEVSSIGNIEEIIAKNNDLARVQNEDEDNSYEKITYTFENQKTYISFVAGNSDTKYSMSVYNIYKIDKTVTYKSGSKSGQTENSSEYRIYGHRNVDIFENKLQAANLTYKKSSIYKSYGDIASAEAYLRSEDFKLYEKKSS